MKTFIFLTTLIIVLAFACEHKKPIAKIGVGDSPSGSVKKIVLKHSDNNNIVIVKVITDTQAVLYNLKLDTAYLIITTDTIY